MEEIQTSKLYCPSTCLMYVRVGRPTYNVTITLALYTDTEGMQVPEVSTNITTLGTCRRISRLRV
jgi:hypothetical protein